MSDPAFVNQASTPFVAQNAPTSSTAASIASPIAIAPATPYRSIERRELVPPVRDEPAVAPGRPAAADVRLEEDDPGAAAPARSGGGRSTGPCSRRRR